MKIPEYRPHCSVHSSIHSSFDSSVDRMCCGCCRPVSSSITADYAVAVVGPVVDVGALTVTVTVVNA